MSFADEERALYARCDERSFATSIRLADVQGTFLCTCRDTATQKNVSPPTVGSPSGRYTVSRVLLLSHLVFGTVASSLQLARLADTPVIGGAVSASLRQADVHYKNIKYYIILCRK